MSTDLNTPLFEISDGDDIEYDNLVAAERMQQERAEQRSLEREEQKV